MEQLKNGHVTISASDTGEILFDGDNTVKLTDNDLDDIVDVLSDNVNSNKDLQSIREITQSESPETLEVEESTGTISVDPDTGVASITPQEGYETEVIERPMSTKSLSELEDEYVPTDLPILDDQIKEKYKKEMDLSDEDLIQFLDVLHRHQRGERFSKFNALPKSIQDTIRKAGGELGINNPDQLRFFTNTMLDEFINDAAFNKEYVDFEEAIKKEFQLPSIVDMHSDFIKDSMEKDLLAKADKFEEEGKPLVAERLRAVSKAFTSSYTFDRVYETLKTKRKVRSRLAKDVDNYKKFCNDFLWKFQKTNFNIHDINICVPILLRKFPNRSKNEVIMFVNTLWHSIEDIDVSVIYEDIYAYYLIKNIMSLDYVDMSAQTDFTKTLIDNIEKLMDTINDYVTEKAQFDAKVEESRRSKKGGKKHG